MAFPTYIKDENDIDFGQECPIFPPNCRYKVASVTINDKSITALLTDDEELLCFPQLVDYFLKDHVAGMPTIYAKVKRMGILARSCNLEQVRLMRSMGAIGPVVNRCKLITMEDFKRLYEDCLLFRGPGRRKRIPSDPSSCGTPVKITIKRPYLEDNDESEVHYGVSRKIEEEMIVNVSSPLSSNNGYFASGEFTSNDSEALVIRRPNGFTSSEDKLGFPSMIYTTFSHPPCAVTLTQSFDNRHTPATSPKTTLIEPINGQMSPSEDCNYNNPSPSQENDSVMTEAPTATHLVTNHTTSGTSPPPQSLTAYHPAQTPPVSSDVTSSADRAKPITTSCGVVRAPSTNVIFTHVNGSNSSYVPRCSNRSTLKTGNLPMLAPRDIRQPRERMTSSETLIGNIQGLLKVTSDNVRMVERQMLLDRDEFAKEFQKECEARIKAEKMIDELQKDKSILQKKLRRSKKANRKLTNHCQAAEQRCLTLTSELQETSYGSLREQNEILQTELEKERLTRIDAEKKLEEARGGIQNFVHNFFENPDPNSAGVMVPV